MTFNPGPKLAEPVRTREQVDAPRTRARRPRPCRSWPRRIRLLRRELDGRTPVIGFCGAPFTLAAYLVQGEGKEGFSAIKTPDVPRPGHARGAAREARPRRWSTTCGCRSQAGAQAIQIFDSWAGLLGARRTTDRSRCRASEHRRRGREGPGVPVHLLRQRRAAPARGRRRPRGPTCSASAGGRRSTRPPRASATKWRCRATSIRMRCLPRRRTWSALARPTSCAHGRSSRSHHESRARHPAGHADRERRGADRGRARTVRSRRELRVDAVSDAHDVDAATAGALRPARPALHVVPDGGRVPRRRQRRRLYRASGAARRAPATSRCRSTCTCRSARSAARSAAATW